MPQKELGFPEKEVCIFYDITCKWNPPEGVWHLSEGGVYLKFTNGMPQKDPSEGGVFCMRPLMRYCV